MDKYSYGHTVTLALDADALEAFESLVTMFDLPEAVSLLLRLNVPSSTLRDLVCAHALSEAGLD